MTNNYKDSDTEQWRENTNNDKTKSRKIKEEFREY